MSIILNTIKKNSTLTTKEATLLDEKLKIALGEVLDKSLTHGFFIKKNNIDEALEIARRTFITNI